MLILHIRRHFRARATEWMLAIVMLLFGVILLQPAAAFSGRPSYAELARIASEDMWGWLCLVVGGVRIAALTVNGAFHPSPHARGVLALVSVFFWFELGLGFMMAGDPLGLAVCPVAAVFDTFNAAMAAGDAGGMDRQARGRAARDGGR